MSLISDVIADIRVEINDSGSTRFTDDTTAILPIIRQAIRRCNRIVQRNVISFGRKKVDTTTVALQDYITMPADFDVDIGLYLTATQEKITKRTEEEWELDSEYAAACQYYLLDYENSQILLKETPSDSTTAIRIWYFPTVDPSAYGVGSTMPWGGRLDDMIGKYVALRLQNIDEMDASVDQALLADLENQILDAYKPLNPTKIESRGWL